MGKRISAYMSVESSVIFSIVIMLYYLVIISSMLLLDRCLLAQNDYIVALRGAMFSDGREEYGEVIYGEENSFDRKNYVESRLGNMGNMYVFFPIKERKVILTNQSLVLSESSKGNIGKNEYDCECRLINPVMRIRECRY